MGRAWQVSFVQDAAHFSCDRFATIGMLRTLAVGHCGQSTR